MKFIGLSVSFFVLFTLTALWNAGAQDSCSHRCGELLSTCSCQVTCQSLGICCPDYKEFCLQISPYSGSLMGGKDFLIENTALNASSVLTCRFKQKIKTSGYIAKDGKAHCISPLLYETGFIPFEVSIDDGLTFPYSGTWLSVHHSKVSDEEKCTLVNETKWQYYGTANTDGNLTLTWTPQALAAPQVNIEVWGYHETGDSYSENWLAEWKYLYTLARQIPSTGEHAFIPVPTEGNYSAWDFGILRITSSTYSDGQRQVHHSFALKRFHGSSEYRREMEDIQRECFALDGEKPKKPWQLFTDRGVRWQLITVIVMTMGQQLSGINAIYFYATYIFEQAGISAEKIPYVTLGTGACECLTALSCGLLIDYVGRRYLIIGGYLLMTLWCTVLTFSLTYQELYSWVPYVSMMSIFAFILSFGLGAGGITNTLTAELFVQSSRPAAYMVGGTVSWISFFTIGMLFPFIVNGLKQYCFLVFLLECSFVAAFIFLVIPETKNKSFLEIKKEFHKLNFGRSTRKKETELYERRKLQDEFLKSSA